MEQQNNITLWKYIKQHWKMLLLILLFPIVINALSFIPNFQIFNKPNSWTEVWAEYGGALLSAGIALVILYKQQKQNEKVNEAILKQNHEENEENRKQNELQNKLNLNLQINALKYQQKNNWYFELRHALNDLNIVCDPNILQQILIDVISYYELTNIVEIDKAKAKILKFKHNYFVKIKSRYFSYLSLINKKEFEELEENMKKLDEKVNRYLGVLNSITTLIYFFVNPVVKKMSEDEIKKLLESILEDEENEPGKLDEHNRLVQKTILKEYFEKYNYDFYGNTVEIINSIYKDYENELDSMGDIIDKILQYERNKIDKLLDEEEIKKNLNAN